jgi:hypothetical protein
MFTFGVFSLLMFLMAPLGFLALIICGFCMGSHITLFIYHALQPLRLTA